MKIKICIFFFLYPLICFGQNNSNTKIIEKVICEYNIHNIDDLLSRLNKVNEDIKNNGIIFFPEANEYLLTGYSYGEFYDWDLYFENIYLSYFGLSKYCFTNLKAFLKRQYINGFVSRTLKEPRPYQHFKPFLAQIALLGSRQINDFTWLFEKVEKTENDSIAQSSTMKEMSYLFSCSYYQCLKEYINFWFWYQDFDKNGLPVWNSADHSGMDNQISRAGKMNVFRYEGVDLACYLYRELHSMAIIAEQLGLMKDVDKYKKQSKDLINLINDVFWDEMDGFYYDRDEHTGKLVRVKSVAGFLPLYIGAASKEKAERLVKDRLLNKSEFWLDFPIPAYSRSEPDYDQNALTTGECNWRGTTWIPTNYMIFHGLQKYGYYDIAKELAYRTFKMVYTENKTTREYFNAETGEGKGLDPFWGWTNLAYFMPFEYELKYNPTDLSDKKIRPIGVELFNMHVSIPY